jgi:hypothetical protein
MVMRSTVAGRADGTTSGTVVLTWSEPTLDASTTMNAIVVTRCTVIDFSNGDVLNRLLVACAARV